MRDVLRRSILMQCASAAAPSICVSFVYTSAVLRLRRFSRLVIPVKNVAGDDLPPFSTSTSSIGEKDSWRSKGIVYSMRTTIDTSRRHLFRKLSVALSGVAAISLSVLGLATQALKTKPVSNELAASEEILRQAGASPAELADFDDSVRDVSPETMARIVEYLRRQSPAQLAKTVESMRYDVQYVLGP